MKITRLYPSLFMLKFEWIINSLTPLIISLLFIVEINLGYGQINLGGMPYSHEKDLNLPYPVYQTMPSFDANEMIEEDETLISSGRTVPYRFGKNFETAFTLNNSGEWTLLSDGSKIWRLGISSPGAYSINLTLGDYYLPVGATLYVYNEDKSHILGAFTNLNNHSNRLFATDLIKGDKIILEYHEPEKVKNKGSLLITMVTHAYRDLFNGSSKDLGNAGACNINVNCPLGIEWEEQAQSVVMLISGGNGFCSGAIINNTAFDGKPYVLTANHCGDSGFASWIFRFNWEAPDCANTATPPPFQSLNGAEKRANNPNSDFLLLELFDSIPESYNPYFSGWSAENTTATEGVGIHHPNGDVKKISKFTETLDSVYWAGTKTWKIPSWNLGTTEPGSSGSPLYDQNKKIIGQLYGGSAACFNKLEDYYGRFSASWEGDSAAGRLKDWLDPENTGDKTINGYNPHEVNFNAGIALILSPEPGSISCADSIIPVIILKNYGSANLYKVNINYHINGLPVQIHQWTGDLNQGSFVSVILHKIAAPLGNNSFTAFTSNPNDITDQNTMNDSKTVNFTTESTSNPRLVSSAFKEDFESPDFPPSSWKIINPDAGITWKKIQGISSYGIGNASAWINNYDYESSGAGDYLITPPLDFSTALLPIYLQFDVAYARYSANYHDSLIISISGDCGINWERLYAKADLSLSTIGEANSNTPFTPTADQWRSEKINLDNYANYGQNVFIKFENKTGNGNNIYLDNVNIFDVTSSLIQVNNDMNLQIFPNPSKAVFNIETARITDEIKIYNPLGEVIISMPVDSEQEFIKLDLSDSPPGIYIIEINTKNGKIRRKINII